MLTITSYSSECCVPSGLDFEAIGDYVVHYFVFNYLLRGLQVAVNMTWALFAETVERAPTPLFGRLVRCSTHEPFFARLQSNATHSLNATMMLQANDALECKAGTVQVSQLAAMYT